MHKEKEYFVFLILSRIDRSYKGSVNARNKNIFYTFCST